MIAAVRVALTVSLSAGFALGCGFPGDQGPPAVTIAGLDDDEMGRFPKVAHAP